MLKLFRLMVYKLTVSAPLLHCVKVDLKLFEVPQSPYKAHRAKQNRTNKQTKTSACNACQQPGTINFHSNKVQVLSNFEQLGMNR